MMLLTLFGIVYVTTFIVTMIGIFGCLFVVNTFTKRYFNTAGRILTQIALMIVLLVWILAFIRHGEL